MNNDTERQLAKTVQALRAHAPSVWDDFLVLLNRRASEITQTFVASSPERLQVMQGQAQEAQTLYAFLLNAPALAEALYQKDRQNAVGSKPQANRPLHNSARR